MIKSVAKLASQSLTRSASISRGAISTPEVVFNASEVNDDGNQSNKVGVIVGTTSAGGHSTSFPEELSAILPSSPLSNDGKKVPVFTLAKPSSPSGPTTYAVVAGEELKSDASHSDASSIASTPFSHQDLREAVVSGVRALEAAGIERVLVDTDFGPDEKSKEVIATAAVVAAARMPKLSNDVHHLLPVKDSLKVGFTSEPNDPSVNRGVVLGESQVIARALMETPANLLTPLHFAEKMQGLLSNVTVHHEDWIREQGWGGLLSVAAGSVEPPTVIEVEHRGDPSRSEVDLVLVGKGVTFDTGGISIKPSAGMEMMKGDMGGAATVASAMWGIQQLGLKANIRAIIPCTENMPSGTATKPGDVIWMKNGLTVEVDNTDAEGRMILADALTHSDSYSPSSVVTVATLTGAIDVALGSHAVGAFATDDALWESLWSAGIDAGELMWRMPLLPAYRKMMDSPIATMKNAGERGAGSCTAAAFLREFTTNSAYAHLDIAGVMHNKGPTPVLPGGMSGTPTRSLIGLAAALE